MKEKESSLKKKFAGIRCSVKKICMAYFTFPHTNYFFKLEISYTLLHLIDTTIFKEL